MRSIKCIGTSGAIGKSWACALVLAILRVWSASDGHTRPTTESLRNRNLAELEGQARM